MIIYMVSTGWSLKNGRGLWSYWLQK